MSEEYLCQECRMIRSLQKEAEGLFQNCLRWRDIVNEDDVTYLFEQVEQNEFICVSEAIIARKKGWS